MFSNESARWNIPSTRLNKRVDSMMETIERVAASNFIDHTMIETLTDSLESAGIDLANLEAEWRKRIDSRILETEEVDRLGNRMQRIMEYYRGTDRKQFGLWIEKSYDLLVADRAPESLHFLKSAYEHDPANHELGLLLAEVYFQSKEYTNATECLNQVLEAKPDHFEATFLMGLVQQRKGNLREAQTQAGNCRRPEEGFFSRTRHARLAARRSRQQEAGAQTSVHGAETEAQRARAFPAGRGLLRRGTAQTRHPASEDRPRNSIRSSAKPTTSSDCCAWK